MKDDEDGDLNLLGVSDGKDKKINNRYHLFSTSLERSKMLERVTPLSSASRQCEG